VATFSYVARDGSGQQVVGTLDGTTPSAVVAELQNRGLAPVRVSETSAAPSVGGTVPTARLAAAYRQLADLLKAGVPLLRALRLLARGRSNRNLADAMGLVADAVADGERLGDAMARFPRTFPPVQVAMIRAGERGGFLDAVFARLGSFLEKQSEMRGKVVGNLIYPVVLLTVGVGLVVAALVFFVPQFEALFAEIELPLATRLLLALSAIVTGWWPLLALLLGGAVAAGLWAQRKPAVKRRLARVQVRIPGIGAIVRDLAVARFCRTLGTLLENGIPFIAAMQISRDAAGNLLLAEAIDEAAEAVRSGEALAAPLARSGFFGEDTVEMIGVGESANNLPTVLVGIADTAERRIDGTLSIVVRLMEPALLLLLAGLVMFIFLALVLPMMQMSQTL
jgi:general secretion pathway protein F